MVTSHVGLRGNEPAVNLVKKGTKIIKKNSKIPLTSVKTLFKTKSDHKTNKPSKLKLHRPKFGKI